MGCRDRTRWRLRALAFQHVAACVYVMRVQAVCAHRNTESLTISHGLLLVFSQFLLSLSCFSSSSRTVSTTPGLPIQARLSGKVFIVNVPFQISRVGKGHCYTVASSGITWSIIHS
ncbi:hypothetical protein ACS0PU_000394 [Formica fusca]